MRTPVLLTALAAFLAVPAAAGAYARTSVSSTGACLFLPDRVVDWAAAEPLGSSLSEAEALAAIRRSFAVWEAETCSDLAFVEQARTSTEIGFEPRGDNLVTVVFRDVRCADVVPSGHACWREESCANEFDCWDGDARQIALTTTTFSTCSGEMKDSDVELNAAGFRFTAVDGPVCGPSSSASCVDTDLENTLVHEIGHVIGLDHTPDPEATMYASAPGGETKKRDLGDDDRAALCAIYPAGRATPLCAGAAECDAGGGSDAGSGCAAVPGTPAAAGLALAFVALALLRRHGAAR